MHPFHQDLRQQKGAWSALKICRLFVTNDKRTFAGREETKPFPLILHLLKSINPQKQL
jgi:hypothetical protein